jgi:hypothetical protein
LKKMSARVLVAEHHGLLPQPGALAGAGELTPETTMHTPCVVSGTAALLAGLSARWRGQAGGLSAASVLAGVDGSAVDAKMR